MNVIVTADARELRRAVGVTAWCVLEELLLDAQVDAGRVVASTNVRRVAAAVGVSKDTAARAVARLVRAGVVERVTSARGERGTFPTAVYAVDVAGVRGLHLNHLHLNHLNPNTTSTPNRTSSKSTSHNSQHTPTQLSLLNL